jgi:hypothetical protein
MKAASVISDPNYPFDNIIRIIGHENVVIFETRGPNVVQQIVKTSVNHVYRYDTNIIISQWLDLLTLFLFF